jgi:hypothetical protein
MVPQLGTKPSIIPLTPISRGLYIRIAVIVMVALKSVL